MIEKSFVVACILDFNERTVDSVVVRAWFVDRAVVCDDGSRDLTDAIAGGLGCPASYIWRSVRCWRKVGGRCPRDLMGVSWRN